MSKKSVHTVRLCTTGTALAIPTGDPETDGWLGYTLAKSGTITSDAIDLDKYEPDGFFELHFAFTGSGNVTLTYTASNNGTTFAAPVTDSGAIKAAFTTGTYIIDFEPVPARYLKIVLTENGTNTAVITEAMLSII